MISAQGTQGSLTLGGVAYWAAIGALAVPVFVMFLRAGGIDIPRARVPDMVYGRAHRPFVQRALVPLVVRATVATAPDAVRQQAESIAREGRMIRAVFRRGGWDQAYALEYLITCVVMFGSLLGFVWAIYRLTLDLYGGPPWAARVAGLMALVCLPPFLSKGYYSAIYDFPSLLLFSLGLLFLFRRQWPAFLLVFVLACINKETAILLTLVFAIRHGRSLYEGEQTRLLRRVAALQVAVAVVVRVAIALAFRDNPGTSVEFHLQANLELYTRPYSLPLLLSAAAVVLAVFRNWQDKPCFLRQAVWVVVPLLTALPFFGWRYEFRACYEAYPVFLLLALPTVLEALGRPINAARPADQPSPL